MKYFLNIIICFLININNIYNEESEPTIYTKTIENISTKINQIINKLEELHYQNLTKCINIMKEAYQGNNNNSYLMKLFFDSSPIYEDIKNYYNCYNNLYTNVKKEILNNLTFIVIKYTDKNEKNDTEYENSFNSFTKVFGACVPQGCTNGNYFDILSNVNKDNYLIEGNIGGVVNLKPLKEYSLWEKFLELLIPISMIIFIILMIEIRYISNLFWTLFGILFNKCHKNKYDEENIEKILKKNKLNQIDTLNGFIKLGVNLEEVMPGSKESLISNENGLQMVVGLRGIFIIGLFLGLTLQNIFIIPTRIFDNKQYRRYMGTKLYCFLFFFARISQKMLYALSGFELTYKLLFYFDNYLYKHFSSSGQSIDLNNMNLNRFAEENISPNSSILYSQNNIRKNSAKKNQNTLENKIKTNSDLSKNISNKKPQSHKLKSLKSKSINEEEGEESDEFELDEESDEYDEEEKKTDNLIPKKQKMNEILKNNKANKTNSNKNKETDKKKFISSIDREKIYLQNYYKLSFQSLLTFHLRQSYLYFIFIFSIIYFIFWQTQYFAELSERGNLWMIITSEIKDYFDSQIILGTMFLFGGLSRPLSNYYNFFIPAMNEIFFYLFGTSIIYYCYKKNSRLDKSLIIIIILVIVSKFIIYVIFKEKENFHYLPSLDFMQFKNYFFIQMHLLNLSHYCIGMIVGLANYSLQNNAKKKAIVKEFVKLPRQLYIIIKRKYNFIFGLAIFIVFLLCDIFLYQIYLFMNGKSKNSPNIEVDYFKSVLINIFNLFDCEIIISCIFVLVIIVFYSSYSFLRDNFNAYPWKILSRIYFPLIIIAQMQSNWFLFQFAERIDLNLTWVTFVLTLIFLITIVKSIGIYVFFQVPLKKLTKIIYIENNKIIDELNYLNSERSGSRTLSMSETSSIDLNANNTKFYINGRNLSPDLNADNDVIRTDLNLTYEDNDNENSF